MKILHVYKSFYPDTYGGIENFILTLSKQLYEDYSVNSSLLTISNYNKELKIRGLKTYQCKKFFEWFSLPISIIFFFKFLRIQKKYDIIHLNYPFPLFDILIFFLNKKKKIIVTYHSDIIKQKGFFFIYKFLQRLLFRRANHIVFSSSDYFKSSKQIKKIDLLNKTSIIPYGLNKKYYSQIYSKKNFLHIRKKYGKNFFLFIGTFRYYKNLENLIQIFKQIDKRLVIAGRGKAFKKLQAIIKKDKSKNIKIINNLTEKTKISLIKLCKSVILPSNLRSEAFGIALVEGMMFQKPLISCDIGTGTSFVNLNNKTGYVSKPNNKSIKNKILKMSKKKNLRKFKYNLKKSFSEKFNSIYMARQYYQLYKKK